MEKPRPKIQKRLGWLISAVVCVCIVGCETPSQSKSTPTGFPRYDGYLKGAIAERWYDLLKAGEYSRENAGQVVLEFKLHSDGHVSGVNTLEATVPPALVHPCEKAILDSAPYAKWSREMRLALWAEERKFTFTFQYNTNAPALRQ